MSINLSLIPVSPQLKQLDQMGCNLQLQRSSLNEQERLLTTAFMHELNDDVLLAYGDEGATIITGGVERPVDRLIQKVDERLYFVDDMTGSEYEQSRVTCFSTDVFGQRRDYAGDRVLAFLHQLVQ